MVEWIDVNERLPDTEGYYLCVMGDDIVKPFVILKQFVNGIFYISDWYKENVGRKVLYWMPLPKPPKDGENDGRIVTLSVL